jgi:hypothetical protein
MKKIVKNFSEDFERVELFREDLEKIESKLQELSPTEFHIELFDHQYDSFEEVNEVNKSIDTLSIKTYSPTVTLDFTTYVTSLCVIGEYYENNSVRGVIASIVEILNKRKRKVLNILYPLSLTIKASTYIMLTIFLISCSLFFSIDFSRFFLKSLITVLAVILGSYVLLLFLGKRWIPFSVLHLCYKENKPNFFKRKKDEIILLILGAFIGGIITYVTTLIISTKP